MKRSLIVMLLMLAAPSVSSFFTTLAQTPAPQMPPKVIGIGREEVKPFLDAAHVKVEAEWNSLFVKANWPVHQLAMTSMSGPPEAWFISGYESFAAIEKANQEFEKRPTLGADVARMGKLDNALINSTRGILANSSRLLRQK